MDSCELPVASDDLPLMEAIKLMRASGTTAVVARRLSGPVVVELDLVLHKHRKSGDACLKDVRARNTTIFVGSRDAQPSASLEHAARLDVQDSMDEEGAVFAISRIEAGKATVLTRHEGYVAVLQLNSTLWQCQKNPDDVWLTDQLLNGSCPLDGGDVKAI